MKRTMFLMAAFALLAGVSCGEKGGDDPVKNTLDVTPKTFEFAAADAESTTFTVTTNAASWSMDAPAAWFDAVKDGNKIVVTADDNDGAAREHIMTVSAPNATDVKVTIKQAAAEEGPLYPSLEGTDYVLMMLDENSREIIGEDNIALDIAPNEETRTFDWWNPAAWENAVSTGLNFYGQTAEWMGVKRINTDWASGAFHSNDPEDYSFLEEDGYYFHIALKASPESKFTLGFDFGQKWTGGVEYKVMVGADSEHPLTLAEWTEIEWPVSDMLDAGWIPSDYEERYDADNDVYDGINAMFIIFEDNPAVAGAEIQWDACFFYKK